VTPSAYGEVHKCWLGACKSFLDQVRQNIRFILTYKYVKGRVSWGGGVIQ
jgi:hypothetical protein